MRGEDLVEFERNGTLGLRLELLQTFATCCMGNHTEGEVTCQRIFSVADVASIVTHQVAIDDRSTGQRTSR
ncbi:hypothetical protein T484DRAFT_1765313 [Baffinella frigidus]|nr:hypothetical protein T484DRAFT_1765313 [Cryptophyta sp. CCMP2293]